MGPSCRTTRVDVAGCTGYTSEPQVIHLVTFRRSVGRHALEAPAKDGRTFDSKLLVRVFRLAFHGTVLYPQKQKAEGTANASGSECQMWVITGPRPAPLPSGGFTCPREQSIHPPMEWDPCTCPCLGWLCPCLCPCTCPCPPRCPYPCPCKPLGPEERINVYFYENLMEVAAGGNHAEYLAYCRMARALAVLRGE